jgi:ATP-binding cassette subfamily F protein uup
VGGYDDWLRQRPAHFGKQSFNKLNKEAETKALEKTDAIVQAAEQSTTESNRATTANKPKKLSFKDQREYDALPLEIDALEKALEALAELMNAAEFYQAGDEKIQATLKTLADKESQLEAAFARWETLEALLND